MEPKSFVFNHAAWPVSPSVPRTETISPCMRLRKKYSFSPGMLKHNVEVWLTLLARIIHGD